MRIRKGKTGEAVRELYNGNDLKNLTKKKNLSVSEEKGLKSRSELDGVLGRGGQFKEKVKDG